jgi:glutaredoxin 3
MAASARINVTLIMVMVALAISLYWDSASASSVGEFVDKTINSHTIVIFSKTYCP